MIGSGMWVAAAWETSSGVLERESKEQRTTFYSRPFIRGRRVSIHTSSYTNFICMHLVPARIASDLEQAFETSGLNGSMVGSVADLFGRCPTW